MDSAIEPFLELTVQVCQFDRGRFDGPQDRSSDGSFSEHFGEFRSGNGSRNEIALAAVTTESSSFWMIVSDSMPSAMTPRFQRRAHRMIDSTMARS